MRGDLFQAQSGDILPIFRQHFKNTLIANMGYSKDEADKVIASGQVDAVAFGVPFLANPDLPARFERNAPLNEANSATFYTPGPVGYTDYPFLA